MTSNAFGRVDSENNVFVIEAGVERHVGQYPNVSEADALAYFVRKYEDLEAQVRILEQRLASGVTDSKSLKAAYDHLVTELKEPKAVGNLVGLRERLAKTESSISVAAVRLRNDGGLMAHVSPFTVAAACLFMAVRCRWRRRCSLISRPLWAS